MAKLKAPLLSLGASQQLGKTLVFFPWKGLDVVREYVIPANPKTAAQQTQRGYMTTIVDLIHAIQALGEAGFNAADYTAYAAYSNTLVGVMTWFNALIRQCLKQKVAGKYYAGCYDSIITPGDTKVDISVKGYLEGGAPNAITAGNWHYGTSPTALVMVKAATVVAELYSASITGLTNGTKYYFQFRSTAHDDFDGVRSGIYHATPSA